MTRFRPTRAKVAPVPGQARQVEVSFTVKSTGSRPGAEVARVCVHDVEASVPRPDQELNGFRRVFREPGAFEVRVGSSSRLIRFAQTVTV